MSVRVGERNNFLMYFLGQDGEGKSSTLLLPPPAQSWLTTKPGLEASALGDRRKTCRSENKYHLGHLAKLISVRRHHQVASSIAFSPVLPPALS